VQLLGSGRRLTAASADETATATVHDEVEYYPGAAAYGAMGGNCSTHDDCDAGFCSNECFVGPCERFAGVCQRCDGTEIVSAQNECYQGWPAPWPSNPITCKAHCDAKYAHNAVCTDIDECEGVDCGGSSTCANGLDKYTCSCAAGWTGPRECADATVDLGDSYGDGWNGAVAHIDSYGATAWEHRTDVQLSMDHYDGHSALGVPLGCLPDGCYRMHFEDLGGYQGEVSIKGSDGSTILNENDLVADKMYFFTIINGTTSGTSQDCATQSFGVVPSTVCTAEPMMA